MCKRIAYILTLSVLVLNTYAVADPEAVMKCDKGKVFDEKLKACVEAPKVEVPKEVPKN